MIRVLIDKRRILFSEVWDGVDHRTYTKTRGSKYNNALRTSKHIYKQINIPNFQLCYPCKCLARATLARQLLASERDTLSGNTIENWGYLFVYICVWTYVCHFVLWPLRIFVFVPCSTLSHTSLNRIPRFTRITLEIELFPLGIVLWVQLKLKNLWELHFYSS